MQKIKINPMLKIQNFLGVSPLFKVKMLRNCEQNFLQMIQKKKQLLDRQMITHKNINFNKKIGTKHKIKLKEEQQDKLDIRYFVLNQNVFLLPYSKHSLVFKKPKHLQINAEQCLINQQQKLAEYEKGILIRIFEKIIKNDHIDYQNKMYKYRRQMANFIRDNYAKICEKRWKYIIEYNQLKNKRDQKEVKKKDKQLRKLLRTIGCQNILNNDILSQVHRIVDEAKEMKGAPQTPQKSMNFGQNQFKKAFKQYFQTLQNKTKSSKRVRHHN